MCNTELGTVNNITVQSECSEQALQKINQTHGTNWNDG